MPFYIGCSFGCQFTGQRQRRLSLVPIYDFDVICGHLPDVPSRDSIILTMHQPVLSYIFKCLQYKCSNWIQANYMCCSYIMYVSIK